jgi:outer membrane protein assembly factor BamB
VANLNFDSAVFSSVTATPGGPTSYTVTATTRPNLDLGVYTSSIVFRLCQDAACTLPYPGASVTYTYTLTVKIGEWATYQRDATHAGFVHVRLDSSKFARMWEWSNPDQGFMTAAIPADGSVYVTTSTGKTYSLSEATGIVNWINVPPSPIHANSPGTPSYEKGVVYVPTLFGPSGNVFTGEATIRGLRATTGVEESNSRFVSQGGPFNSPTFKDGDMYYAQGNGVVNKYALPSGATVWTSARVRSFGISDETPAVDTNYVYWATGFGIAMFDKVTGSVVAEIGNSQGHSGGANVPAPVITESGKVITSDVVDNMRMLAIDPTSRSIVWRTDQNYGPQPAAARGVIYNWRWTGTYSVHAISDADGSVLWTWSLPPGDSQAVGGMVVCDNLLFVSSERNVYAIDLTTHQTAWTYPAFGRLSISSGLVLYIANPSFTTAGNITAIKLGS